MNKQKGITLIALVITIIVLLILAGISIATLTGENGILKKATVAGEETKKAEYKEILELIGNGLRPEKVIENLSAEEFIKRYKEAIEEEIRKGETLEGAKVVAKDATTLRVMTKEGYIYEITENKVELLGKQQENEEIDLEDPNQAEVSFTSTTVDTETEIIATVTQSDNGASGVNITRCKWGYTESETPLGKGEVEYTGGSFKENPESLKTKITSVGTYYLHILTVDNAGNKTETVKGPITVTKAMAKVGEIVQGENKEYEKNGTAIIPVGFAIKPGCDDIENGLVISDVANDVNDTGNQFVWIPVSSSTNYVEKTNVYQLYGGGGSAFNSSGHLPSGISSEKDCVVGAGGFYIGRYETGQGLVSKKGFWPWTSIYQAAAKTQAKNFINTNYVKSGLISGIQWDLTMDFVNGKKDGTGNMYYVNTPSSSRHVGDAADNHQPTGRNEADRVCNIYDLEGNCNETTAERATDGGVEGFIWRGGDYVWTRRERKDPASRRLYGRGDNYGGSMTFRMVLYIMI
jgi:Tfp pilus assembly major pilin PilA